MTREAEIDFLTGYIRSLAEETRHDSAGPRYGFDHVIYELALAQDLVPVRLSFFRQGQEELASPKKEAEHGVETWERYVRSSGIRVGDKAALTFQRWNLTTITEKVRDSLLTPSLLPENFFRRFTYLCWQVGDFIHNSPQWREVLLSDWREFL